MKTTHNKMPKDTVEETLLTKLQREYKIEFENEFASWWDNKPALTERIEDYINTLIANTLKQVSEEILQVAPGFQNIKTGEVKYDVGVQEYMARIKALTDVQRLLEVNETV
jgi:transcription termination factor NusB